MNGHTGSRWWYLLLVPPYVGLLWVPLYAKDSPELFGFPFFYWYQFAWVPLTALLTWIVYLKVRTNGAPPDRRGNGRPPLEDDPGRPPRVPPVETTTGSSA